MNYISDIILHRIYVKYIVSIYFLLKITQDLHTHLTSQTILKIFSLNKSLTTNKIIQLRKENK